MMPHNFDACGSDFEAHRTDAAFVEDYTLNAISDTGLMFVGQRAT